MSQGAIAKGAVISYISIAANMILTFFYTPWMIGEIGMSDYGLYSLISSFIAYFLMDFGLSKSVMRFVAKYRAEGDERKISNIIGLISKIYIFIDAIIFICLLIVYFFLTNIFSGLTGNELEKLKILYCIAGTFSIMNFMLKPMDGILMAHEFFVEAKTLDMIQRFGTVFLIILILLSGGDVYALVLVNGLMAFVVSVAKYIIFKKKTSIRINWAFYDRSEMKTLFMFSFWVFFISMAQQLRLNLMPTVLGITTNTTEISYFSVGRMIEGTIYTITAALNGLFLPKVSRMLKDSKIDDVTNLMIRVGRIQLYIITAIVSGFIIFGKAFINLWVGEEFAEVYYVLLFMIILHIVSLTQTIAGDMIFVQNKIKYEGLVIFFTSLLSLVLAFPFSLMYGAVGCALAIFIGLLLNLILMNRFYKNTLHLPLGRFFKKCHFKILPLLTVLLVVSYFIRQQFCLDSWLTLLTGIVVYTVLFFILSYRLLFNQEEKEIVRRYMFWLN